MANSDNNRQRVGTLGISLLYYFGFSAMSAVLVMSAGMEQELPIIKKAIQLPTRDIAIKSKVSKGTWVRSNC